MDVVKKKKTPFYKTKYAKFGLGAVIFVGALIYSTFFKLNQYEVDSSSIVTATIKRGPMAVTVAAPGVLASRDDRWVASIVEGKVDRILVRPGAEVEAGQLLVEMNNFELEQRVNELTWELEGLKAESRALEERRKTRLLELKAELLDTKLHYEQERMRLDAEQRLIKEGNATVSKLDFETRKLAVEQLAKKISMNELRKDQLQKTLKAEFESQNSQLNLLQKQLERAEFQFQSLQVKAPISGVLQALPLDLGERVAIGDNIAKIARQDDLIAELKVPEFDAFNIGLGQNVMIDTRTSKIKGRVIRVDPAVVDGTVQVDVELTSELPISVRSELSVDGEILISEKMDTLYVRRPIYSQASQTMSTYRLDKEDKYAHQINVQFGMSSSMDIEILSGANEGDVLIVSEIEEFANKKSILLN